MQFAMILIGPVILNSSFALGAEGEDLQAPLVGRKEPFCGAIGRGRFEMATRANPTHLQAGDPIILTIRIQSIGQWHHAPLRPDLTHKPDYSRFRQGFHIQNGEERLAPDQGKWEFDYSLRPKNERVKEIPSLVIVYFRPGLTPPEKGYMTTSAPAIPLQLTARNKVEANEIQGKALKPLSPDSLYQIVTGPEVLRAESNSLPVAWLLVGLIIGPPILSLGWLVWWGSKNPNAIRRSRLRKSRAGRQALRALQSVNGVNVQEKAGEVAGIVSDYLKHRFQFQTSPTGVHKSGLSDGNQALPPEVAERIAELFRNCDGVRYAPANFAKGESLAEKAASLIVDLESQP